LSSRSVRIAIVLFACVCNACGSTESVVGILRSGSYALETIDGRALPLHAGATDTTGGSLTVVSADTLRSDLISSYRDANGVLGSIVRDYYVVTQSGPATLLLKSVTDGRVDIAAVSGNVITLQYGVGTARAQTRSYRASSP
jgi:hypothetical protein